MRLYPESLLITAAVLLPNLLFLVRPPLNVGAYGKPVDSVPFTILERVGQVSSFLATAAWIAMGLTLAFYFAGWLRFFWRGRDYALLFKPMLGIPVPMAVSPVLYFLLSSVVLGSIYQAIAAAVLGIGHITISAREYLQLRRAPSR